MKRVAWVNRLYPKGTSLQRAMAIYSTVAEILPFTVKWWTNCDTTIPLATLGAWLTAAICCNVIRYNQYVPHLWSKILGLGSSASNRLCTLFTWKFSAFFPEGATRIGKSPCLFMFVAKSSYHPFVFAAYSGKLFMNNLDKRSNVCLQLWLFHMLMLSCCFLKLGNMHRSEKAFDIAHFSYLWDTRTQ